MFGVDVQGVVGSPAMGQVYPNLSLAAGWYDSLQIVKELCVAEFEVACTCRLLHSLAIANRDSAAGVVNELHLP
jgi:hypothetical protein